MRKRGQVAIFIILAIFIAGATLLVFLIPKNIEKPPEPNTNQVYSYVYSLIENEAFKCLQQIGEKGGYYEIPDKIHINNTAYWYYEGVNVQPFLNTIENETSVCINKILKNSTDRVLSIFGNHSLEISSDRIRTKVRINKWRTTIEVDYPMVVSKGSSKSLISDFEIDYRINLLKLYELATGVVNYASIPEFDKCNPSSNCYGEDINFSFFNDEENLFIKGQTFAIFSNQSREEPYELNFAIKRPIKEAFKDDGKRLAVLYQEQGDPRNFGGTSLEVLKNTELVNNVDYYKCEEIGDFILKIKDYDIVVITGGLQYQVREGDILGSIIGDSEGIGDVISGCNSFGPSERKSILKNWVNSGGLLWINGVGKLEADSYEISYLGSLGYESVGWQHSSDDEEMLGLLKGARYTISQNDVKNGNDILLKCPNDISKEIVGVWASYKITITDEDEIVIGSKDNPSLWTRNLGNGQIIFDNFILSSNSYEKLGFNDDLFSKGLAEKYFVNILNYLAKSEEYKKSQLEISLISPLNDEEIENPVFYFQSQFGKNASYNLLITDKSGATKNLVVESKDLTEERFSKNKFKVDFTNRAIWSDLEEERYEWQIKMDEYFSDIGSFKKKLPVQINETAGGNETSEN